MAEFGENLRKAREDKGMTQQTLADKIYVTRQAVSRWEGGSRYPDLMTAKKLAALLDTTLDELVREDNLAQLPQVNPVIEYPLTKRIQTAAFTFCFVPALILTAVNCGFLLLTATTDGFSWEGNLSAWLMQLISILSDAVLAGLFGLGTVQSIKDNMTPKMASLIAGVFFGASALRHLLAVLQWPYALSSVGGLFSVVLAAVDLASLAVTVLYFTGRGLARSSRPVYAVSAVYMAGQLLTMLGSLVSARHIAEESMGWFYYSRLSAVVTLSMNLALLLLLAFMAHELDSKRKVQRQASIMDSAN